MILQVYNILHVMLKGGRDCEFYHRYGCYDWKLEVVTTFQNIYIMIMPFIVILIFMWGKC